MTTPLDRPAARTAGPELLVLAAWEESVAWLLGATARWPKSARFTVTQRLENHALDVLELLVEARYCIATRRKALEAANLKLERMRFLLRIARASASCAGPAFEGALRRIDEAGRMMHGWRQTLAARAARQPAFEAPRPDAALNVAAEPA